LQSAAFNIQDVGKDCALMVITGGNFQPMYHSEHRQIESLREIVIKGELMSTGDGGFLAEK
jgi:hypothetical protein